MTPTIARPVTTRAATKSKRKCQARRLEGEDATGSDIAQKLPALKARLTAGRMAWLWA